MTAEILVHTWDEEPCDLGLDPFEDRECQHGFDARWRYVEEVTVSDFHVWRQIAGRMDACAQCGVVAPQFPRLTASGIVSEHRPLPRFCPGEMMASPHIFDGTAEEIGCVRCCLVVTQGTMPNEINWACRMPCQGD